MGGRGKGGGVALVHSPEEAAREAARMLEQGFGGAPVTRVLVERLVDIAAQFYAAISLDRSEGTYLAMVSNDGGIEIEEVARTKPRGDPSGARPPGPRPACVPGPPVDRTPAARGARGRRGDPGHEGLRRSSPQTDATLVEINPFVLLTDGTVMALDSKVTVDDNALFRQPDVGGPERIRSRSIRSSGARGRPGSST